MPEYIPDLLDLGVVGEVHGPYRPVRLLEEAQARVGEGEVELVVFYIWRPLGSSGTEAVLVRREHRFVAQVQGALGHDPYVPLYERPEVADAASTVADQ